jgi:hypothetical protein
MGASLLRPPAGLTDVGIGWATRSMETVDGT